MKGFKRNLSLIIHEFAHTRHLLYINGARQVGKSTLCAMLEIQNKTNYITFDNPMILSSAKSNPADFIDSLPKDKINIIDEVQFVPEIFPYLKIIIDESRLQNEHGVRFILTGSANIMALPTLSSFLVGRMSIFTLYPFCMAELLNNNQNIVDTLFNNNLKMQTYNDYSVVDVIKQSTFPEIALNKSIDKNKWFDDYLTTIFHRDVKAITDIKKPEKMIMVLSLLAMRTGSLLNNTAIAQEIGMDYKTYEKFLSFGINSFLVFTVKSWSMPNKLNKRFTKSPKLYFIDCNLLCYVLRRNLDDIFENDSITFGHIFENFVATELLKHCNQYGITMSHFRTHAGKEVDFVLENASGELVGIEVKSSKTVDKKSIQGLLELQTIAGTAFKNGIVFYTGTSVLPLAEKIWAVPICYLWHVI